MVKRKAITEVTTRQGKSGQLGEGKGERPPAGSKPGTTGTKPKK